MSRTRPPVMVSGRTIAEKREHLETASERLAAHKKIKQRQASRIIFTVLGFAAIAASLFYLGTLIVGGSATSSTPTVATTVVTYKPSIEVIDEDANATGGYMSSRMSEYIGMFEEDIRAYGYVPVRAVIPTNSIREVDFYLDGYSGFIKTTIDRGTGVTAEDTDRLLRYLAGQGITTFQYIDVRLDGKAYWK